MFGDIRAGAFELVYKLAAHVHHAGLSVSFTLTIQPIEACKAIGMHGASIAGEMIDRMLALAIRAELVPRAGRRIPTLRALIAYITPEPRGLRLLRLQFALQLDRRVIGKKYRACPDQLADMIGQWFQQSRAASHPIGQGGAAQVDLFAGEDFGLPVQRHMIAVFANQDMGQKPRAGAAPFNRSQR